MPFCHIWPKLPNAVERSDYVFRFARKLQIEDQQLLAEVKKGRPAKEAHGSRRLRWHPWER